MKENGKTVEVRPNRWEVGWQRLRNLSFLALGLGALLGAGWIVAGGGVGTVVGQAGYASERDLRQTSTKHKEEEKKE